MTIFLDLLLIILLSPSLALAQSQFSLDAEANYSFGQPSFSEADRPPPDGSATTEDDLELRMRYPELYGGNLAAGSSLENANQEAQPDNESLVEMQTRYPELYLSDRLYNEDSVLSLGGNAPD